MKILIVYFFLFSNIIKAPAMTSSDQSLSAKQKSIIIISAHTAKGDLSKLKTGLNAGLDAGFTINEIKEILVHLYAYCGFPRSIRGLQTFMEVLDERKVKGINDETGPGASPVNQEGSKYDRGKKILEELQKTPQSGTLTGYAAFAPIIDTFLKEHLFADIFERDVLTYAQRELVTISVLSAIGGVEPMLRSHLSICLNTGLTTGQLGQFIEIMRSTIGEKEAESTRTVLNEVIESRKKAENTGHQNIYVFQQGEVITNDNFTGTAYLQMLVNADSIYQASIGNVTFEPGARTKWHIHPGGQILLVTSGKGLYQAKGLPAQIIRKGDVIKIAPDLEHWHGASPDSGMTHIAISLNLDKGNVVWLQHVTGDEYNEAHEIYP